MWTTLLLMYAGIGLLVGGPIILACVLSGQIADRQSASVRAIPVDDAGTNRDGSNRHRSHAVR